MTKKTEWGRVKPQSASFIAAARALGCDESEEHFNEALAKVARHKPLAEMPKDNPKKNAKQKPKT